MRTSRIALLAGLALLPFGGCSNVDAASVQDVLGRVGGAAGTGTLDDETIVAGLKEALQVGTRNAVRVTSQVDGYLRNPRIHIPLPDEFEDAGRVLRGVGLGSKVDELKIAMNRAAEKASAEAVAVFFESIRQMTIADARSILDGGDDAATQFFRRTAWKPLFERFRPIVSAKLREVGLARIYGDLVRRYNVVPLVPPIQLDIDTYVVEQGLEGLFVMLADEERRIRNDPAARITDLLETVFAD